MKRKILIFLGIVVVLSLTTASYFTFGTYSTGFRTGYVIKFSKKGYVFKTWEGQLSTGGLQGQAFVNNQINPTIWDFSVTDGHVVSQLNNLTERDPVKLHYREKFFKFPWSGDTKYFIYQVEVMTEPK